MNGKDIEKCDDVSVALADLDARILSDYTAEDYSDNVIAAAERLCAVIERLRMKINGEPTH